MQRGILHYLSVFTPILNLIIVVASNCSGLNQLTTYYGCISLFCHLKMCVRCGLLEFKGLVMSRRWVRLSRETWPLTMKFDVLETLLSKCEFWYSFPRGCTDSEKKFGQMEQREWSRMNTVLGIYSHIHNLIGQSTPCWKACYFMVPDLGLYQRDQPFLYRATSYASSSEQITHMEVTLLISQTGTPFENKKEH